MIRLIRWLLGLGPRRNPQAPYVFPYHDGTHNRSADIVVIEQSLRDSLGEDWRDTVSKLNAPVPAGAIGGVLDKIREDRRKHRAEILAAVDKAFDVHEYRHPKGEEPSGLVDDFRIGLLTGYMLFCIDLMRIARPFVIAQSRASPTSENQPQPSEPESTSVETSSSLAGSDPSPAP